jgi:hypothetical protein
MVIEDPESLLRTCSRNIRRARQVTNTQLARPRTAKIANMPIAIRMNFKALPPDGAGGAGGAPVAGAMAPTGGEGGLEEAGTTDAGGGGAATGLSAVPHLTQNLRLSSFGAPQFVQYLVAIHPH